jgi:hypothetical protein
MNLHPEQPEYSTCMNHIQYDTHYSMIHIGWGEGFFAFNNFSYSVIHSTV